MWRAGGVGVVYGPTNRSFKVYVNWADTRFGGGDHPMYPNPLTAQAAEDLGWFVRWTAIGP